MQAGLQGVQEVAEEKKQRQFADILHKLTVNNVDQLLGEVQTIDIATPDTLVGFVNQIFNKAVTETTLCEPCADLCKQLYRCLPQCAPCACLLLRLCR